MIEQEKAFSINWGIVLNWVIPTCLALILSDGLLAFFVAPTSQLNTLVPGIIIATLQWQFFRRNHVAKGGHWFWVTLLAWSVGLFFGRYAGIFVNVLLGVILGTLSEGDIVGLDSSPLGLPTLLVFHSLVVGTMQWALFMRNRFKRAFWWVPTTIIGWSASALIGWGLIPIFAQALGWHESGLEDSAIRGIIFGLFTGITIQWLMQQPLISAKVEAIDIDDSAETGRDHSRFDDPLAR